MVQDASQRRRASRASSELISTTFVVEVLAFIAKIPVRRGQFPDRQANRTLTSMTPRSEEHTSELQSLMRISYAVFCLKKKITTLTQHTSSSHYINYHSPQT